MAFYCIFQQGGALSVSVYAWWRRRVNKGWQHWSRTPRLHFPMETAWLIRLACCLFQHSCSERLDRQKLPAVTQMQYHWLIETGDCSWSKAHAGRSHPVVHNVSKVYHPMIRLINGTAAEQRTWLKCKYPKCKWLNWIMGNYKVSSWDLLDFVNGSGFCEYQNRLSVLKMLWTDDDVNYAGSSLGSCCCWHELTLKIRISFICQGRYTRNQVSIVLTHSSRSNGTISKKPTSIIKNSCQW